MQRHPSPGAPKSRFRRRSRTGRTSCGCSLEFALQHLNRSRYYDTNQGRFLSNDEYLGGIDSPPSLNRYVYALNAPVIYTDPSGHTPVTRLVGLVLIVSSLLMFKAFFDNIRTAVEAIHATDTSVYLLNPDSLIFKFLWALDEIFIAAYAAIWMGLGWTLLQYADRIAVLKSINRGAGYFPFWRARALLGQLRAAYLPGVLVGMCGVAAAGLFRPRGELPPLWSVSAALCVGGVIGVMGASNMPLGPL